MELKEFIHKSLTEIFDGIKDANQDKNGAFELGKLPDGNVLFDVAITVSSELGKDGGAKLNVMGISVGGEGNTKSANEVASRIKFCVNTDPDTSRNQTTFNNVTEKRVEKAKIDMNSEMPAPEPNPYRK
ncbi:hypothetical protein QUF70_20080 [Desulfobacterales bacterium HSG17]|nr:hypothetical protein [Desulfobacterales bacterium HSG17]